MWRQENFPAKPTLRGRHAPILFKSAKFHCSNREELLAGSGHDIGGKTTRYDFVGNVMALDHYGTPGASTGSLYHSTGHTQNITFFWNDNLKEWHDTGTGTTTFTEGHRLNQSGTGTEGNRTTTFARSIRHDASGTANYSRKH